VNFKRFGNKTAIKRKIGVGGAPLTIFTDSLDPPLNFGEN